MGIYMSETPSEKGCVSHMIVPEELDYGKALGLPCYKYKCEKCGVEQTFCLLSGKPQEWMPCGCGGRTVLVR